MFAVINKLKSTIQDKKIKYKNEVHTNNNGQGN